MRESRIFCFGFGLWKHRFVRAYMRDVSRELLFCTFAKEAELRGFDHQSRLLVWGVRESSAVQHLSRRFADRPRGA